MTEKETNIIVDLNHRINDLENRVKMLHTKMLSLQQMCTFCSVDEAKSDNQEEFNKNSLDT